MKLTITHQQNPGVAMRCDVDTAGYSGGSQVSVIPFPAAHRMDDASRYSLDDVLVQWHCWARGYKHVGGVNSSAMFRHAKSSRGWDSVGDIIDAEIDGDRMELVNFHVFELSSVHCTAIQINARNLETGRQVWSSARLPEDVEARAVILRDARQQLLRRLILAGVV